MEGEDKMIMNLRCRQNFSERPNNKSKYNFNKRRDHYLIPSKKNHYLIIFTILPLLKYQSHSHLIH